MKFSTLQHIIFLLFFSMTISNVFSQNSSMSSLLEQKEGILNETEWNYLLLRDYNRINSEYSSKGLVSYVNLVGNSNMEQRKYEIFITPYNSNKGSWVSKSYSYQLIEGEFENYKSKKLEDINVRIQSLEIQLRKNNERKILLENERREKLDLKKRKLDKLRDSLLIVIDNNIQIEKLRYQKYNRAYNQLKPLIKSQDQWLEQYVPNFKDVSWILDDFKDENYNPYINFVNSLSDLKKIKEWRENRVFYNSPKENISYWYEKTLKEIKRDPINSDVYEFVGDGYMLYNFVEEVDVYDYLRMSWFNKDNYKYKKWEVNSRRYNEFLSNQIIKSDDLIQSFYDDFSKIVNDLKEYNKVSDWIKTKIIPLVFKVYSYNNGYTIGVVKKGKFKKIDKCLQNELPPLDYKFIMKILTSNASLNGTSRDFEFNRKTSDYDFNRVTLNPGEKISIVREFMKENPSFVETNLTIDLSCF